MCGGVLCFLILFYEAILVSVGVIRRSKRRVKGGEGGEVSLILGFGLDPHV